MGVILTLYEWCFVGVVGLDSVHYSAATAKSGKWVYTLALRFARLICM